MAMMSKGPSLVIKNIIIIEVLKSLKTVLRESKKTFIMLRYFLLTLISVLCIHLHTCKHQIIINILSSRTKSSYCPGSYLYRKLFLAL